MQDINGFIDGAFDEAEAEFHALAAVEGARIVADWIPIDTHTLQMHIQTFRLGKATVIQIPDATLFYSKSPQNRKARALAAILQTGVGKAGNLLMRTQSNIAPGAQKGTPTKGWWTNAENETVNSMRPIARQLMRDAARKIFEGLTKDV